MSVLGSKKYLSFNISRAIKKVNRAIKQLRGMEGGWECRAD